MIDIRRAMWVFLGTTAGERVMWPEFGGGVHDLVFAPHDPETATRTEDVVRASLFEAAPCVALKQGLDRLGTRQAHTHG